MDRLEPANPCPRFDEVFLGSSYSRLQGHPSSCMGSEGTNRPIMDFAFFWQDLGWIWPGQTLVHSLTSHVVMKVGSVRGE